MQPEPLRGIGAHTTHHALFAQRGQDLTPDGVRAYVDLGVRVTPARQVE